MARTIDQIVKATLGEMVALQITQLAEIESLKERVTHLEQFELKPEPPQPSQSEGL